MIPLFVAGILTVGLWVFKSNPEVVPAVYATETTCDSITNPQEKLTCLQNLFNQIQSQRSQLEKSIASENATQSSLYWQISLLNNQISQTELNILEKKVLIEQSNTEILILESDILTIIDTISATQQELSIMEAAVTDRIGEMYKTMCIDEVELMFSSGDVWTNIGDMKYFEITKAEDEALIERLSEKYQVLKADQEEAALKRDQVIQKTEGVQTEHSELLNLEAQLNNQKADQQYLLALSQAAEASYAQALQQMKAYESAVSGQMTELIMALYNSGMLGVGTPVTKGTIVGFQGHTGCALGSHLHFEFRINGYRTNPLIYLSYSGGYVIDNANYKSPMKSAYVTCGYGCYSGHYAIDMVSYDPLYYTTARYSWDEAGLRATCGPFLDSAALNQLVAAAQASNWQFSLVGEGAPVLAIADGVIYRSTIDGAGANYVLIDHGNGVVSLYLHLR